MEIVETRKVTDRSGETEDLHSEITPEEGEFIASIIEGKGFNRTLEVGCAFGVSSLYICDALSRSQSPRHCIIDPYQTTDWRSIGVDHLARAGFNSYSLMEEPSELALPRLLQANARFEFALIDGWHTFDHTLLDFFYINRLLEDYGVVVFDDAHWPSVSKVVRYVLQYPNYVPLGQAGDGPSMVALQKTGPDERSWDWYEDF